MQEMQCWRCARAAHPRAQRAAPTCRALTNAASSHAPPPQADRDSRDEINKVFRLFDVESKGFLTIRDLAKVAKELGESLSGELCARVRWCAERAGRDLIVHTSSRAKGADTSPLPLPHPTLRAADSELQEMIERADTNGDGKVSQEDFYEIMTRRTG